MSEETKILPYLYLTAKLHQVPFKHRFIAGSSKCTTNDLSCLLPKVLTTVEDGVIRYCNTKASSNGVNGMWIVKNSTSLLSSLDHWDVHTATTIQRYDCNTKASRNGVNGMWIVKNSTSLLSSLDHLDVCTAKSVQRYDCNTKASRNGVNGIWIVKNSTSLLSSLDHLDVHTATSVQRYDFDFV